MSIDIEPKSTESAQTAYEVFGFSDAPLDDLKQILIDMGFTQEVEGDYPHNSDLSACAQAFPNRIKEKSPSQKENRITVGSGVNTDLVPVEILTDLKKRVPDIVMFDGTGRPIAAEK